MSSHPPSFLIQPSRPTTATSSSDTSTPPHRFLSSSSLPTPLPPPPQQQQQPRGPIPNLLPIFTKSAPIPGTVRIRVEHTTFLCHREVLALGSPFFEALLMGDWREMAKREGKVQKSGTELEVLEEELDGKGDGAELELGEDAPSSKRDSFRTAGTSTSITSIDQEEDELSSAPFATPRLGDEPPRAPFGVEDEAATSEAGDVAPSMTASYLSSIVDDHYEDDEEDSDDGDESIICRLRLKEEQASTFQDFLSHLYPRLELLVTWANASELLRLSAKFDVPSLRNACIAFLLPSCAGNPIKGMKIAEDNWIPELFKEASRFALDNYGNWPAEELGILSEPTLLKLERRRSWFLERLLKLGLIQISRDYSCVPTCPDPTLCAKLVDEKWKSAWSSAFRFGTPQPSITYRSLRSLEPSLSSPALHLPMTACQDNARLFIADLFDRMFLLSITPSRGWGSLTLNGTMSGSGGYGRTFGPSAEISQGKSSARYFLFIEMHDNAAKKERQERSVGGGGLMASSA